MIDALYDVEFVSNVKTGGHGIVIFHDGLVMGGNASFVYMGTYGIDDGLISAKISCKNDIGVMATIFGDPIEFSFTLTGKVGDEEEIVLKGALIDDPTKLVFMKLNRRAELP
uniref:Type III secretion system (T3SS) negative regulator GrlR n=1 Tax=Magnetococcus massalia (strain MO-1) TaxID=451514 RepID=A0A1S7LJ03_MAGMO|nr:protein of unknown function [Candidatus Magnetococcus massalia]